MNTTNDKHAEERGTSEVPRELLAEDEPSSHSFLSFASIRVIRV